MKTLQQFMTGETSISPAISWYLADIDEAKGRQELFTRQSPQRLKVLREHALIESAVSSNRIEQPSEIIRVAGTGTCRMSWARSRGTLAKNRELMN